MRRELTDDERKAIVASLEKEEKHLATLKEGVWYIDITLENQEKIWEYEDKIRDYKRRMDKEKFVEARNKMLPEIQWSQNSIDVMKDQLSNGVEVIENKGGENE